MIDDFLLIILSKLFALFNIFLQIGYCTLQQLSLVLIELAGAENSLHTVGLQNKATWEFEVCESSHKYEYQSPLKYYNQYLHMGT